MQTRERAAVQVSPLDATLLARTGSQGDEADLMRRSLGTIAFFLEEHT